jgi:general secretion pathway protein D
MINALRVAIQVAIILSLAACGLGSMGGGGGRPLLGTLFQSGGAARASNDGAISASGYVSGTQAAIIERGTNSGASFESSGNDPALAALQVTLNFVDTDVREFARVLFSELLKKPYVVDQNLSGLVTVRSGGKVDGNAALVLAKRALEAAGNTILLSEGVYRVTNAANASFSATANVKTFHFKHIDATAAQGALQGLVQGRAEILNAAGRSLSMRGDVETLALVASMLQVIDVDRFASASFGLFPLKNGSASTVAEELRVLYQGVGVTNQTILPIERMNSLLVIAVQPEHLDFAQKWIQRLDQGQQHERQIYVYQVKNRDADELAKLLQEVFSAAIAGGQSSVRIEATAAPEGTALTAPGAFLGASITEGQNGFKITADSGSNTLVVWAKRAEYELVSRALQRLDTPLSQVYVEATIAEVRLNGELSHGVRWFLESGGFSGGISDASNGAVGASFPGFNFALKVPQAQVVISALESHTDVRIVSTPQLTVIDRETATIQVGDQVPIVTKTVQDTSSGSNIIANDVTFRDTGVILRVTPRVRSSGEVLLDIEQEVSRVVPTTSSQINSPTISQRKVASTVLVPDGTAIVLAGLMSASDEIGSGGLPGTQKTILESIFGSKKVTSARSELIVIIRPIIIRDRGDLKEVIAEIAYKMQEVLSIEMN